MPAPAAARISAVDTTLAQEFDRQVEVLLAKGYPAAAGLDEHTFLKHIKPLRKHLAEVAPSDVEGRVPFVIVVSSALVPVEDAMPFVDLRGKRGVVDMPAVNIESFAPIEGVTIPRGMAYLLADIDSGADTLNVTPDAALPRILEAARTPLTLEEGVAVVTQYPEILRTHNAFSLLASRCGDKRVPAIWVAKGEIPRLGWCWAGNPHTWLGSASCATRIGRLAS